jgi:hypothetical protein
MVISSQIYRVTLTIDFPGAGDDEIAFQRGETIVVMARDDGFGDGWWTVILPEYILVVLHFMFAAAL